jgi:tetratricopeptide (TPR) repeat protein
MQFDPENKVVKLCAQGMQFEAEGDINKAKTIFQQAWDIAENDFEAFTAAHYLARNQDDPNDTLKWNLEALNRAKAVKDVDINGVYPSLYLNVGKSYETLQDLNEAGNYYQMAADCSADLPPGKYSEMIRTGISKALERTGISKFNNPVLDELVDKWCERRELIPLGLILPAYNSNLGTRNDINKLISALSYLSATRCLNDEEQTIVDDLVVKLSASISN